MENLHKSQENLWEKTKKVKDARQQNMLKNKKEVDKQEKQRVKELIRNKNKSDKAIEEHQKQTQHNIMLKQELRKLREQDIQKIKERNKRLEMIKKQEIIEKQLGAKRFLDDLKRETELHKKKIMEEDLKDVKHKDHLASTLLNVTKSPVGPAKRNKILAGNRLNISISEKLLRPVGTEHEL